MASNKFSQTSNQPPVLLDYNAYSSDPLLQGLVNQYAADAIQPQAEKLGNEVTSGQWQQWVTDANRYPPLLKRYDRNGHKINQVEFNPAYHHLMSRGKHYRLHCLAWDTHVQQAQVARAALYYLYAQMDQGPTCPLTMTYAVIPVLQQFADQYAPALKNLMNANYDPRFLPMNEKTGLTMGMGMTEKQGGSDVRANITQASKDGDHYRLLGHKWFCSAPMSDAFLMLGQAEGGLSCFFVPRFCPDGSVNNIEVQQLKNKLGNHSNASSEIELENTYAEMLGEPGRGVATIIKMVNHTRFDCALGSSAHMRQSVVQAIHHCRHRQAFGKKLVDQALMQNVLADACIESAAAITLTMRIAHALDSMYQGDQTAAQFVRLTTAIAKYWICKRTPMLVNEMLEVLGGCGYVEDFPLARLYRDAPLNSIWEGSGNIQCLDVLRAIQHAPECLAVVLNEIQQGLDTKAFEVLQKEITALLQHEQVESQARRVTELLALGLQASLLQQQNPNDMADLFIQTRLGDQPRYCFGQLPTSAVFNSIINNSFI
ncbi:MAG: acyl-CoA dehydrogenase family protein [Coxiellaceae bacterium]|nr:acyl-CoA dehydrogenase family protein [Coxiellaceae bacterium]